MSNPIFYTDKSIFNHGKRSGFGLPSFQPKGKRRVLGIRDKQILYRRARGYCESCGRKIDFDEMHSGHKNAASKGGSATLRNSVCVCARCNKLQGTDSWATFMKKMGKSNTRSVTSGKKTKRKTTKKRTNKKSKNPWDIQLPRIPTPKFY